MCDLGAIWAQVFGADVYHAPPGSSRPSFAAVVSSMDRLLACYHTSVCAQPARLEIIEQMEALAAKHIRRFYEVNGGLAPRRIIVYRDGVGISQFPAIGATELRAIRRACRTVGGEAYRPTLTFIIVQKRNHCRLFSHTPGLTDRRGAPKECTSTTLTRRASRLG